jgi:hypothetical protein
MFTLIIFIVVNNVSVSNGEKDAGGICMGSVELVNISYSKFKDMSANIGGVLYLLNVSVVLIERCDFNDSKATDGPGGSVYVNVKESCSFLGLVVFSF